MKTTAKIMMLLLLAMSLSLAACSSDDENSEVEVKVTDAPFPFRFVNEANIQITAVELLNENNEYVKVFEGNANINMVNYRNGATANLAVQAVPPGKYTRARVTVEGAELRLTNQLTFRVQAGLNGTVNTIVSPALVIEEGESQEILLDIDLSESFVFEGIGGPLGGFITSVTEITGVSSFTPDVRVCNLELTGSLEGTVTDTNGEIVADAEVYVEYDYNGDGIPEKVSTVSEEDGSFEILGLPEGQYTLTVQAENRVKATVSVQVEVRKTAQVRVEMGVN